MEWGNTKLQHEIFFYEDSSGNKPVLDYMKELKDNGSKDSRIKLSKIQDYVKVLREYGTSAGVPFVNHLDGEIWELRPIRDRILFAGLVGGHYVLLHQFMKKTQKTPAKEIEKAKKELAYFKERSGLR